MKKIVKFGLAVLIASFFVACDDSSEEVSQGSLTLNLNGLEELGDNYVYEGWLIVNGAPVSTGTFTSINFPQSFNVNKDVLDDATRFVLSIEPAVDPDPAPAATKLLAGNFSGSTANVMVAPVTTSGSNFTDASGLFFLRTPTDEVPGAGNNNNDHYGIWFGNPGMPPTASLNLPELAPGWVYEGWVVVPEVGPISTGTFTNVEGTDDSNGFSGSQNNAGPPIPGEDFFLNAPSGFTFPLDVRGKMAVISIEPVPDNSPAPFLLKPLAGLAGQETAPSTHNLNLNLGTLPTGTVTR